ncbi:MAG TPA: Rieske 2Fe-2S domain-containing protein [Bdellovibrionota bacterium]|nr:Rieske 2Fe-2S domain-containing protein [Bdellovibrionota bacterium]
MSEPIDRRRFFTRIGLAGMGAALGLAWIGVMRFFSLKVFYERSRAVKIGKPEEFTAGSMRLFSEHRFFLFRDEEGFYAISAVCTHLGCVVRRIEETYECPCHGSAFDQNGQVTRGPAPAPLKWLKIAQSADGYLVVNLAENVRTGTRFNYA